MITFAEYLKLREAGRDAFSVPEDKPASPGIPTTQVGTDIRTTAKQNTPSQGKMKKKQRKS